MGLLAVIGELIVVTPVAREVAHAKAELSTVEERNAADAEVVAGADGARLRNVELEHEIDSLLDAFPSFDAEDACAERVARLAARAGVHLERVAPVPIAHVRESQVVRSERSSIRSRTFDVNSEGGFTALRVFLRALARDDVAARVDSLALGSAGGDGPYAVRARMRITFYFVEHPTPSDPSN
jgi:hypothetical protein